MAQQYEYGFLPEDEEYLGLLGNIFSPVRREVLEAPTTEYVDVIDAPMGTQMPVTTEGVYGDPEFGLQYMPAYQAVSSLLGLEADQIVDAAKAAPEALRQMANQQVMSGVDMATGGTGILVDDEGNEFGYDPYLVAAPLAPAGIAARSAGGATLGAMGGRGMIGHNNPPVVVGRTPYIVQNELRGTEFRTAELPDGSRTLIDAAGNPYIEEKTINKLLTGIPHTEMSSVVVPSERGLLVAPREVFPEQFEGQWMVNATGDRTRGGVRLIDVNGRPLYGDGTELMGGDEFMLYNQAPWASASSAITAIANQAKRIRQGVNPQNEAFDPDLGYDFDAPINLVTTNMAERSGDFAVDTAETLMRMMPTSKIKSKDLKAFDKEIKAKYPDYPSSKDPDKALEWIMKDAGTKGAGDRRKFYVATMAKGEYQSAGFPDIGSVRAAISRPETRFMPYGRTGGAISLLAPEGELPIVTRGADVVFPHKTYPDQVGSPNSYLGGYGITLGRNMAFPDSYARLLGRGSEQAGIRRVFDTGREYQFMTPEVVDTQMQFIEDQKAMLRNYGLLNDIY